MAPAEVTPQKTIIGVLAKISRRPKAAPFSYDMLPQEAREELDDHWAIYLSAHSRAWGEAGRHNNWAQYVRVDEEALSEYRRQRDDIIARFRRGEFNEKRGSEE